MPAIFAHKLIAKITLFNYPEKIKKIIHNYKEAYYSGTLGPDPLYFYGFMKKLPLTAKADEIHRTSGNILFAEKANNEEYLSFMFGFITHYTLDKNIHKYVHQIENEFSHVKLERKLEYLLLKSNQIDYNSYNFNKHIILPKNIVNEVARLLKIDSKTANKAYKDTNFIIKYAYNLKKRKLVNIVMKLTKTYEKNKNMLFDITLDPLYQKKLETIYDIWLESIDEIVVNVNNYYDYIYENKPLNSNFNYNFEGEVVKN